MNETVAGVQNDGHEQIENTLAPVNRVILLPRIIPPDLDTVAKPLRAKSPKSKMTLEINGQLEAATRSRSPPTLQMRRTCLPNQMSRDDVARKLCPIYQYGCVDGR